MKKPAIITTRFPTMYEVADALGVTRERADELAEMMRSPVKREPRSGAKKKRSAKAASKRAIPKSKA